MQDMTIGQLARKAGIGVETIRFYERKGLVIQPLKPNTGRRTYPPDLVERVRFIRRAKELGFSLREIVDLLTLGNDPQANCADVRSRALSKLSDVEEKIESLQKMKETLAKLARTCSGNGPISECPILEAIKDYSVG